VNKFCFVIGLIIAVGVMLVIPSPMGQMAKASTCSSSASLGGTITVSTSATKSGSCSTGSVFSPSSGASRSHGGSASSCTSVSGTSRPGIGFIRTEAHDSNGAVSCSSHSP
jgi:hypothetical protein